MELNGKLEELNLAAVSLVESGHPAETEEPENVPSCLDSELEKLNKIKELLREDSQA